ncbi:MAG: hypothetical protein ABIT04_03075 [Novosphingobium sp.]
MRMIASAVVVAAGLLAAPALQARPRLTPDQQLDRMLAGREAGTPVDCISLLDTQDTTVIDKTAIVYGRGRTIWVNRPGNARSLDSDDILVTRLHTSQLCSLDIVHLRDRSANFNTGFVNLNQFVPYRRVALRN